jgi:hypothetical protein
MPRASVPGWTLDPLDPRAPSDEVWDALTPEQRAIVVEALPSELEPGVAPTLGLSPPEGDFHDDAVDGPRRALRRWFGKLGHRAYVGSDLAVYYPGAKIIAPDLFVVLDVDPHRRRRWVVREEGKGVDLALEVHDAGSRRTDFVENVSRFAALGIREYFAFDLNTRALIGYRLDEAKRAYERIAGGAEGLRSQVLGLDLEVDGDRVRFSQAGARIPELDELIGRLEGAMTDTLDRIASLEGALATERAARETEREGYEAERAALERRIAELEGRGAR